MNIREVNVHYMPIQPIPIPKVFTFISEEDVIDLPYVKAMMDKHIGIDKYFTILTFYIY